MRHVYMDHASATPVSKIVIDAMLPLFDIHFGNPSNVSDMGSNINRIIEDQRAKVAELIGAKPEQIIFTSSGAEANNLAIKGVAFSKQKKGNHIIVSAIEHHSVLNSARFFERLGFQVTFLMVDEYGKVDPQQLLKAIRPETILVSIMHANNEIGTIEPVADLACICREKGVFFHTDAAATVGKIPVDIHELGVDLMSISGPSFGAPKGTGALYFRDNVRLMPLIHGGIQEKGRRAGTENVPAIVGLGKASEIAAKTLVAGMDKTSKLKDCLVRGIFDRIDQVTYTGHPVERLPGHASFCIGAIEGEALLFMLNQQGIYSNTGSACASKALKTSPVLVAIGVPADLAQGSVVFTTNSSNSMQDVEYILEKLPVAVEKLRVLSPIWHAKKTVST